MRVPLDYYRILGLPIQATAEQLQQAHRDRTLQLPRREYSEAAILARRQLIDEAYDVLSSPEERQAYDAGFLAKSYELDTDQTTEGTGAAATPTLDGAADPYTPSIEIHDDQLIGALLILLELGEYELVIKLGRPYLSSGSIDLHQGRFGDPKTVLADVVLTIALACLELGREQWQQGQYENAAESLDTGQELLRREGLFENIRNEVQSDLYKLRPYRVLELLALPETRLNERRQGLQLLQRMLQERGGIDGNGDDYSGLNIDDFLRFVQQLRKYLTAAEQQTLFEAEARRPSAVATYLAVYALLARGFAQQQPALIRRAKQMLVRLGSRQDVHLEQAVCALLLGQTEEASRALELSQEYEPLAFIREHSQGAPDLLPGLCLYAERWLQQEVFPHFRDLAHQQASLKSYFANEHVQSYLEALPNETETSPAPARVAPPAVPMPEPESPAIAEDIRDWRTRDLPRPESAVEFIPAATAAVSSPTSPTASPTARIQPDPLTDRTPPATNGRSTNGTGTHSSPVPTAEYVSQLSPEGQLKPARPIQTATPPSDRPPRFQSQAAQPKFIQGPPRAEAERVPPRRSSEGSGRSSLRLDRLGLLVLILLVSLGALGFLMSRALSWLTNGNSEELAGEQLMIQIDRPLIEIPDPATAVVQSSTTLTQEQARQVIETWLNAKQEALGPEHQIDKLDTILVDPVLTKWRALATEEARTNSYRGYEHEIFDVSVVPNETNPNQAIIETQIREKVDYYDRGLINESRSDDSTLTVRYTVVQQDDGWRIQGWDVGNGEG